MKFYKYQRINEYSIDGLKAKTLFKADPKSFNDPFELRLMHLDENEIKNVKGFDKFVKDNTSLVKLTGPKLYYTVISQLQEYLYSFRVVCFTEKKDNILMWAHYTDNHKGICLGFEVEDTQGPGLYKVEYNHNYPEINLEQIWHKDGLAKILFTKSVDWIYEQEWRRSNCKKGYTSSK